MLVLNNAEIVTGDGRRKPFRGSIAIEDGLIAAVSPHDLAGGTGDTVIDLGGRLTVPGAIDAHAHATAPGPRFASGTPGVPLAESLGNLRRHLTQGHTTVVDLDGFKSPADHAQVSLVQPVKVEMSSVHFDPMFGAADACDGSGLSDLHRGLTAQEMKEHGAVVLGEVGAGMTLGGGGQDYIYIPAAIEQATGVRIVQAQAQQLKYAALGRHIRSGDPDRSRLTQLIEEFGLSPLTVDDLVGIIEQSVLPSIELALDGLLRSASLAVELQLPTLVHNSAPSDDVARQAAEIAGGLFIGGHTNHPTFSVDEALASARWIRDHGGHVEVDTFDLWTGGTGTSRSGMHECLIALAQADMIDIIATDYAAGHWDGMWEMAAAFVQAGLAPIERAVAMATGNLARAIPRIGATRGVLTPGRAADLVVTSPRTLADVELVIVDGEVAYSSAHRPLSLPQSVRSPRPAISPEEGDTQ
ncbi:amidohydrolase family protein [Agromyces silvae]|uniref:amidohydrolase family protein n=1 Tax=Agromyces silvae TaxID=3388266 RepID=UPI00280BDA2F|nr:amidohydrolase family protein [Agromyces protaetiae]